MTSTYVLIFPVIDQCAGNPCDSNALCEVMDDSFTCTCNAGYSGDGLSCESMSFATNGQVIISN